MSMKHESNAQEVASLAETIESKPLLLIDPLDEVGNATLFARHFSKTTRYCVEAKSWYSWTGKIWKSDEVLLWKKARHILRLRNLQACHDGLVKTTQGHPVQLRAIMDFASSSASKARLSAMLDLASKLPKMAIPYSRLDQDLYLINCPNGTVDLRTGSLEKNSSKDFLTHLVGVAYDPDAKCPSWDQFIDEICSKDQDLADYLQEIVGYSLSGVVQEQVMFLLVGKGANGKSTFLDTILHVFGTYGKTTPAHTFVKSDSRAVRNDVARLQGARFVSAVEINTGKKLDEAMVKGLTGGDRIAARFLRKEFVEFTPQAKFFLAVNVFPEVSGADDGIYRRLRVVPFQASFDAERKNKALPNVLKAEAAGIFAWAVRGFLRWQERGALKEPEVVTLASDDFRAQMDVTGSFINDYCAVKPGASVAVGTLFESYLSWCKANALEPMSKKLFGVLIRQKGYRQTKSGNTRIWKGLAIDLTLTLLPTALPSTQGVEADTVPVVPQQ
jgi:putative DNA primase/helicase